MNIKVLSYNIHKGFDWNNRNYYLHEIKELILNTKADLVFLQEVVGQSKSYSQRKIIDNQYEYLSDSIWPHYSYGKNAVYDHGHHGNLILSKYPIKKWHNFNISTNKFEKRGLLICEIEIPLQPAKKIFAVCVHINLLSRDRNIQYKLIKKHLSSLSIPEKTSLILAGDFNDWNQKATQSLIEDLKIAEVFKKKNGDYARTFPAFFPLLKLDRIYVKNLKIKSTEVITKGQKLHFSDHLPLACELSL